MILWGGGGEDTLGGGGDDTLGLLVNFGVPLIK